MDGAVEQVLARRARQVAGDRGTGSLAAAALLHAAALAVVLVLPRFETPPEPLEFVPVQIVSAQALGTPRPLAQPKRPAPPAPEPAAAEPEPEPPAPETPEIPAPEPAAPPPKPRAEDLPVLPKPEEKKPAPTPEKPAKPAATKPAAKPEAARPAAPGRGEASSSAGAVGGGAEGEGDDARRGSPTGRTFGTSAFGSEVTGLDPSFTYGYYIDRLLSLIDAQWERPTTGGEVRAVIFFRIQKSGEITDVEILESSGSSAFDLAARRAVENAAPFPPLPSSYRNSSLGVNLIVR